VKVAAGGVAGGFLLCRKVFGGCFAALRASMADLYFWVSPCKQAWCVLQDGRNARRAQKSRARESPLEASREVKVVSQA